MATVQDLMGAGMPALLASLLAGGGGGSSILANDVALQGYLADGVTPQDLIKVDPSNNTVIDATGNLTLAVAGTTRWFISSGGILQGLGAADRLGYKNIAPNGSTGVFTLNGATPVVVSNNTFLANDMVFFSRFAPAGTVGFFDLTARSAGVSFTVTGTAGDTSQIRYVLIRAT